MCAYVDTLAPLVLAATTTILLFLAATNGKLSIIPKKSHRNHSTTQKYLDVLESKGPLVQFILFTRRNPAFSIKINDSSGYQTSGFNISNPTKIIIHGYQSSIKEEIFIIHKNAYLESGDYNVIGMDWSPLCSFDYFSAIKGLRTAGTVLAEFLDWLADNNVDLNKIHLVGHSLGAHVAGVAGHLVKKAKVGRITGLDPAAPGFKEVDSGYKLDIKDAKIVEVIHTYMKVLSFSEPMGHIDFYPNGGRWQPGCPNIYDVWTIAESLICNHARSYLFFAESIRNKKAFKSKYCSSVEDALYSRCFQNSDVYMGQVETYKKFGLYYVRTRAKKPFSLTFA